MNPQAVLGYVCLLCFSFMITAKGDLQPLSFQPGTLYQYRYTLDVQLDHTSTQSPQGAWLRAEALVQLHWLWRDRGGEELLQVQIRDLKAQHRPEEERSQDGTGGPPAEIALSQEARAELQQPVFISWSSGKVKAFYGDETESILVSNLKRGIVSLLQLQPHAGTAVEEDVSGSCQVTYTVSNHSVTKTKDLLSCSKPKSGFASVKKASPLLSRWWAQLTSSTSGLSPKSSYRWAARPTPSWLQPSAPAWDGSPAPRPTHKVGCTNIPQEEHMVLRQAGAEKMSWVIPSPFLLSLLTCQLILLVKVDIQKCFLDLRLIGLGIRLTGDRTKDRCLFHLKR